MRSFNSPPFSDSIGIFFIIYHFAYTVNKLEFY
nr:MAG TPA: hypothetical protein [Bacteriophage sp.]